MDLRDTLNRYYYDSTVCELRQLAKNGGGELSYNSMMYLDVISYQAQTQGCTVGSLARTLHISPSAATLKVNELTRLGFVRKCRDEKDRRVVRLEVTEVVAQALRAYDSPLEKAVRAIEEKYTPAQLADFCSILDDFSQEYMKGF